MGDLNLSYTWEQNLMIVQRRFVCEELRKRSILKGGVCVCVVGRGGGGGGRKEHTV